MRDSVVSLLEQVSVLIGNGQSVSADVDLGGLRLAGILMPAAWTAAVLTFQVSFDHGATWSDFFDATGEEYRITVAASRYVVLEQAAFSAVPMIRVRSGTSAAPVAQGAARTLNLALRVA